MCDLLKPKEELLYKRTICLDENSCSEDYFSEKAKTKRKYSSFASMKLNFNLLTAIRKKGYTVPTPIQRKVIPHILMGQDLIAMARTGSGKTLAFVIPILQSIHKHESSGIRALILSSTRELCQQTYKYIIKFSKGTDVRVGLVMGGDSLTSQFELLSAGPDIIVASPGRMLHLLSQTGLSLKTLQYLVFDEADRLLEMGFKDVIQAIIAQCNPDRQTLLFSATLPSALIEFSRAGLKDPEVIRLDTDHYLSHELLVEFFVLRSEEKLAALIILLKEIVSCEEQVLVFVATRHHAEYLYQVMLFLGIPVTVLYGKMDAAARKINYTKFVRKISKVMVVTDIAARGVDIPELDVVINYDFPDSTKLFIHRVGRTARAGKSGKTFSFVQVDEFPYYLDLKNFLKTTDVPSTVNGVDNMVCGRFPQMYLEIQKGYLEELNRSVDNLSRLYNVLINSRKRYNATRSMPSSWAIKLSKEMADVNGDIKLEVHSMLTHLSSEHETNLNNFIKTQIKNFRPRNTIFEVEGTSNVVKNDKVVSFMQKKRTHHDTAIQHTKSKVEKRMQNKLLEEPNATRESLIVKDSDEGHDKNISIQNKILSKTSDLTSCNYNQSSSFNNSGKQKDKKDKWKDNKYFLPLSKFEEEFKNNALNIGTSHNNETLEEMEFHLAPDEDTNGIFRKKLLTKWVKNRKNFVKLDDTDEGRKKLKIRNESGKVVIINDAVDNKLYEKWMKKTGKKVLLPGENKEISMPQYEFYRHKSNKKSSNETSNPDQFEKPTTNNARKKVNDSKGKTSYSKGKYVHKGGSDHASKIVEGKTKSKNTKRNKVFK